MEKKKIIIAGTEEDLLNLLTEKLEKEGCEVFRVKDGQQAFDIAKEISPDLIIAKSLMPKMNGDQLIKRVRQSGLDKNVQFIVTSERKNMEEYFELLNVDQFIPEPFTADQILAAARKALSAKPAAKKESRNKVLVAGRDSDAVDIMVRQLREENCHTDCVCSGDQVITKAVLFLPSLLVIENEMYGMSSYEIIKVLRQMPQFKKLPIVVYSHNPVQEITKKKKPDDAPLAGSVNACLDLGASEYIGPFSEENFISRIFKYIRVASIVLIDDNEGTTKMIKSRLEANEYKIFAARDGGSGMELIKSVRPSLVLLDVVMPGTNGLEVLQFLKSHDQYKDIPVIMITVKGKDEDVAKALALGADDYMVKPFNVDLLMKRISHFLKK